MTFVKISEAERVVMRVLWTHPPLTSHEVILILSQTENWQPTTIKTLINRLMKKNYIAREKKDKKYLYSPLVSEQTTIQSELSEALLQVCARQKGAILDQLLTKTLLSVEDLEIIEKTLSKKKQTAPKHLSCDCPVGQCHCKHA